MNQHASCRPRAKCVLLLLFLKTDDMSQLFGLSSIAPNKRRSMMPRTRKASMTASLTSHWRNKFSCPKSSGGQVLECSNSVAEKIGRNVRGFDQD